MPTFDKYGGYVDRPFNGDPATVRGPSGGWRVGKQGDTWVFITPLNNCCIIASVFQVTPDTAGGSRDRLPPFGTPPVFNGKTVNEYVLQKFGDNNLNWAKWALKALRDYGFNGCSELGYATDPNTTTNDAKWNAPFFNGDPNPAPFHNPNRMAQVLYGQPGNESQRFISGGMTNTAKDIFTFNPNVFYNSSVSALSWVGIRKDNGGADVFFPDGACNGTRKWVDPYDPNFARGISAAIPNGVAADPWRQYCQFDDTDDLFGASGDGAPSDNPENFTNPGGDYVPHMGWATLVSASPMRYQMNIEYSNNGRPKVNDYSLNNGDTTAFAKQALKNFLIGRYGTIAALNTAWGSTYTSFENDGGWRSGSGLMDEDGRSAHGNWMGFMGSGALANYNQSSTWGLNNGNRFVTGTWGINPVRPMKQDLDDFFYLLVKQYLTVYRDQIRIAGSQILYVGPSFIGGTRAPVLKAAADVVDVIPTGNNFSTVAAQQKITDFTVKWIGDRPMSTGQYYTGGRLNSAMYGNGGDGNNNTQAQRAAIKITATHNAMEVKSTQYSTSHICMFHTWDMYDLLNEGAAIPSTSTPGGNNYGIFTVRGNPYDGNDYTSALTSDPHATWTGGTNGKIIAEDASKVYGNYIGPVADMNLNYFFSRVPTGVPTVPTADFGFVQEVGNQTIDFTDTSSGFPVATGWAWNFGDGQTSALKNPTHPYTTPGLYTVTHTATNTQGTSPVKSKQVPVGVAEPGWQFRSITTNTVGTGTACSISPAVIAVGDLVVVLIDSDLAAPNTFSVTDSLGHPYTATSGIFTYGLREQSFYTVATSGASNPTITIHTSAAAPGFIQGFVYIASVVGTNPSITLHAENHNAQTTPAVGPISSNTITTTAKTLLLGWASKSVSGNFPPDFPLTQLAGIDKTLGDALNVTADTYRLSANYSGTSTWAAQILAFRASGSGGGSTVVNTSPADLAWKGQSLSVPGIIALGSMTLTWTGKDLDIQTTPTTTVVTTQPANLTWTGQIVITPSLHVRATLTLDFFNRTDGPLT